MCSGLSMAPFMLTRRGEAKQSNELNRTSPVTYFRID